MIKKKGNPQKKLGNFFEKTGRRSKTKKGKVTRKKTVQELLGKIEIPKCDIALGDGIIEPVDGLTDFRAFLRPEPCMSTIVSFGLVFKLLDVKCLLSQNVVQREKLQLYGLTENQNTVLVHINDHHCSLLAGFQNQKKDQEVDLDDIRDKLNSRLKGNKQGGTHEPIIKIQLFIKQAGASQGFKSLTGQETRYLKFYLTHTKYVEELRKILKSSSDNYTVPEAKELNESMETYFKLHFLKETKISAFGWVYIQPEDLNYRADADKISTCQIEVDVNLDKLIPLPKSDDDNGFWPLRIVSFDLECETKTNEGFPKAEKRPIIQIANTCRIIERSSVKNFKNIFVVGSCAEIKGATIYAYRNDEDLLRNWRAFIHSFDPDIMIGYNIVGFDFRYISKRAQKLNIPGFFSLGRLKNLNFASTVSPFVEKLNVDGRIIMDMPSVVRGECTGLTKYGLGSVSRSLLGETKCDVAYSDLFDLQHENAQTRRKIAIYCIQDTSLPMKLMDKLNILRSYTQRAREIGVLFPFAIRKKPVSKAEKYAKSTNKDLKDPKTLKDARDPEDFSDEEKSPKKKEIKKLYRSTTQAIGKNTRLTSVESLIDTLPGPFVFKTTIPALYKKQNYKLEYLSVKRMFLKVYNKHTLESLAYLADQAYENLHSIVEKVEEIFVFKCELEEPKPGQKILRISNAIPLDINSKAIEALRSLTSMVWINNSIILRPPYKGKEKEKEEEENVDSDMDLELIDEMLDSMRNHNPLPTIIQNEEGSLKEEESNSKPLMQSILLKEEEESQKEEEASNSQTLIVQISQKDEASNSRLLEEKPIKNSSPEKLTTSVKKIDLKLKRSFTDINTKPLPSESTLRDIIDSQVTKKNKTSSSFTPSQKKIELETEPELDPSAKTAQIEASFLCYPNLKWILNCKDKPLVTNKSCENSPGFVTQLMGRDVFQLYKVSTIDENFAPPGKIMTEEVCILSDQILCDLEDRIRTKVSVPNEFSLMNAAFFDRIFYYFIVHSSIWCADGFPSTSGSQDRDPTASLYFVLKVQKAYEYLFL